MILTYAVFFALFLSTRITPVEAVAVPKNDLIKLRFHSTFLAPSILTTLTALHLLREVTGGASSTNGNNPTGKKRGCRAGKNERRRRTGCAISVLVTSRDYCSSPKQVFERNLVKIKISRAPKIPSLKRFDETPVCPFQDSPPVLKPERTLAKSKLPNILVCNARSLNNKTDALEVVARQNNASIIIISECWDTSDESARIKGYTSYFNTRHDRGLNRRGGGVGLYVRNDLSSRLLSEPFDSDHEILWTECKPTRLSKRFSCLIVASVYYPESAKNRKDLIEHIQFFVDKMRRKHVSPGFVIAGDFNQTNRQWVSNILDLRQAVTIPTHQSGSILDLILTNLTDFYYAPRSLGPLLNSDHFIIFWEASSAIPKPKRVKYTVRPLTEDSISTFGRWIGNYQFEDICSEQDINIKVNKLNTLLQEQFQTCFPVKVITVSDTDKPWITNDLKNLIKTHCRLHIAGDTVASAKLRNHIVKLNKRAKRQYVRDKITPLLTIDPHKWHSSVKRLTGKTTLRDLRLLKEDGTLTSANEVNSFFADICTSFPSITKSEIDTIIAGAEIEDVCEVSEFTVYKELLRLKANCASYPGELPVKLLREFAIFLAKPLSSIINQCFLQQVFPSAWKRAYVRVIPKVRCPKSCDQLRPISITPNLSKVAETFIQFDFLI
ncbi:uncharacterized protein LOC136041749 [Artemia franciscana]|uniref:uncharacterized protein LOC136041749 n=1 Tax=Artemia franciscana TaxID=6661 RepID=UPI0032DAA539